MKNNEICISVDFVKTLVEATNSTAMKHRGKQSELYALGQLESIANLLYISVVGAGDYDLENYCQKVATDALDRMASLLSVNREENVSANDRCA